MATTPNGIQQANDAVASAKKALANADNSSVGTKSGHSNFAPKSEPTHYAQARTARKTSDEFMGIRSNQAPEINTALKVREDAKKALDQ